MAKPSSMGPSSREGRSRSKRATGPDEVPAPGVGLPFHPAESAASGTPSVAQVSGARRRILEALVPGERTIPELARILGFHPATIRYHLGFLVHHDLVEERMAEAHGGRGRPPAEYRISRHAQLAGFPPRHYELLAEIALRTLLEMEDPSSTRRLKDQGAGFARAMVEQTVRDAGVARWGPEAFQQYILGDLFGRFGVATEVASEGKDSLTYRSLTCPFLELAERVPQLVCDALDLGFHEGIDDAVGGETRRFACMGHGDPYCEYRTTWAQPHRGPSRGGPGKRRKRTVGDG